MRQDTAVFYIEVHGLVSIVTDFKALFLPSKPELIGFVVPSAVPAACLCVHGVNRILLK